MLKQMRSFLVIILFEWILTKPIEQSSRETFFISVPFILLLFLDVFRVSEDTTFIMMPTGNRFCVYSSWCSFEVFQMKGTREALTIQHCFYCLSLLYKQKMYFNFPRVSVMINQAGFIHTYSLFSDLWLTWKTCQASLSENSAHLKKIKIAPCLLACLIPTGLITLSLWLSPPVEVLFSYSYGCFWSQPLASHLSKHLCLHKI